MKLKAPLILASQSPRREQLLREAGFEFEVVARPTDEYLPEMVHPRAVAVMVSENKAKLFHDLCGENIVITADTIVALKDRLFGKPEDEVEAFEMLKLLSGKTHSVVTGVTLFYKGKFHSFSEETLVTFRQLDDSEIRFYIEKYKPYDKAGAYAIQEWIGMIGISRIEGDYYNVVGLPIGRLYQELIAMQ